MAGNLLEFTDANFQTEVLQSDKPVLVDFWAPWCAPCLKLKPTIAELADEYKGRFRIGTINTEENPGKATELGVSAIPSLMIFKGGNLVERMMGVVPKSKLTALLDTHL